MLTEITLGPSPTCLLWASWSCRRWHSSSRHSWKRTFAWICFCLGSGCAKALILQDDLLKEVVREGLSLLVLLDPSVVFWYHLEWYPPGQGAGNRGWGGLALSRFQFFLNNGVQRDHLGQELLAMGLTIFSMLFNIWGLWKRWSRDLECVFISMLKICYSISPLHFLQWMLSGF